MAKFLKSIFTVDKRKSPHFEGDPDDRNDFIPTLDGRRKLSMSRSGRMKQANKKRHSLTLDLYGEDALPVEKPKNKVEYHVNNPVTASTRHHRTRSDEPKVQPEANNKPQEPIDIKTPEEEIESAFQIIDQIDKIT